LEYLLIKLLALGLLVAEFADETAELSFKGFPVLAYFFGSYVSSRG